MMIMLTSGSSFNGPEQVAIESMERPAPVEEQEEQKHARPFAIPCQGHMDPGATLSDPARATDDRLLPSPHSVVLLRPPKQFL